MEARVVREKTHTEYNYTTTYRGRMRGYFINTGYFIGWQGLFKTLQTLLGIVCMSIVAHFLNTKYNFGDSTEIYFLVSSTSCLIPTFCILLSSLLSLETANTLPKTKFELIYHFVAFILSISASIALLVDNHNRQNRETYEAYLAASILGIINGLLYLGSVFMSWTQQ